MADKKEFKITRTVVYTTYHFAHYEETIEDLIEMGAPLMWQKLGQTHVIEEVKEGDKNEKTNKRS